MGNGLQLKREELFPRIGPHIRRLCHLVFAQGSVVESADWAGLATWAGLTARPG